MGKHDEAIEHFDRALELDDAFTDAMIGRAKAMIELGRWAEAGRAAAQAAELGVTNADLQARLADAPRDLGDLAEDAPDADPSGGTGA
jgi:tetratricopeptide (TPR) repeat protein